MPDRPSPPTGEWLTEQLRRAEQHAANVEPLLEAAVAEVLDQAADLAARGFQAHAVDYLTAAAPGVTAESTMIALKPTPEQAAALALAGGEPAENLHVTLCFLGETTGPLSAVVDALRPVAMRHASLSGTVGGMAAFMDMGDGYPVLALPDVPGLVELRVAVTEALVAAGIDYARNHGYCPHMTLAYMPEPAFVEAAAGAALTFGELLIVRGDTEIVPLPLSGRPPLTAGATNPDAPLVIRTRADLSSIRHVRLGDDRSRVPIPGTDLVGDMRDVDRLMDLLKAENATVTEIRAVAERHRPDGGYGDTYWHAEGRAVFWVCGDWTTTDEADAAEADFLAVDGVDAFEACWECYAPGDGWEQVYATRRWTLAEIEAEPLVQWFPGSLHAAAGPSKWGRPAADEIIDVDSLIDGITARTKPVRDAAVEAAMTPTLGAVGIAYDVTNPMVGNVLAQSASQIVDIAATTQLNVMRIVRRSYEEGLSIPHTADAIRQGMREATPARARLIARTELVGAVNGGSLAAVRIVEQSTGVTYTKVWMTAPRAKHPRHYLYDGLNGQTKRLAQKFDVGMSDLDHPGDPEGPPREICNCRCTLRYEEGTEQRTTTRTERQPRDDVSVGAGPPVPPEMVSRIDHLGLNQWPPAMGEVARRVFGAERDTVGLYKKDGDWSEPREALHDRIVASHFAGKTPAAAGEARTAYMTSGGGASGKSGALFESGGRDVTMSELRQRPDVVHVDADAIKEMLPEYKALRDGGDRYAASGVHEESSAIARRIVAEAQQRGYSMILDSTGSSSSFMSKIAKTKAAGYDVQVTMVSLPTNTAITRAMLRGDRSGRYIAVSQLKDAHAGSAQQMLDWTTSPKVDRWRVYDNTTTLRLVAHGTHGKATIIDAPAFDAIKAKAVEVD